MAKQKSKAAPQAIQTRDQAVTAIARIGTVSRQLAQIAAEADEKVAAIAAQRDADTIELKEELKRLNAGLQTFCEVNRAALTNNGKVKFHDFGTGRTSWRSRPPRVTIRGVEVVIEACRALGLARFIRTKEEINKEAMLAEPTVAASITGVSIGPEGEDFVIEVLELADSETKAA